MLLNELLENNIIRESKSPFASPVILVKKKNGADRLVVDYRELNANTVRDHYPLPLISDQLDQLAFANYFCCLDMASGFHQIQITEDSIEKTLFMRTSVEYLGYVVGDGKIRPSPSKIEALARSTTPRNVKQLRQFNGLAGYFRKFIPDFSKEMIPLYDLTKANTTWKWTVENELEKNKIIDCSTSELLITMITCSSLLQYEY